MSLPSIMAHAFLPPSGCFSSTSAGAIHILVSGIVYTLFADILTLLAVKKWCLETLVLLFDIQQTQKHTSDIELTEGKPCLLIIRGSVCSTMLYRESIFYSKLSRIYLYPWSAMSYRENSSDIELSCVLSAYIKLCNDYYACRWPGIFRYQVISMISFYHCIYSKCMLEHTPWNGRDFV